MVDETGGLDNFLHSKNYPQICESSRFEEVYIILNQKSFFCQQFDLEDDIVLSEILQIIELIESKSIFKFALRISFIVVSECRKKAVHFLNNFPKILFFNFFKSTLNVGHFIENMNIRHLDPKMARLLELERVASNYDLEKCYIDESGQAHIYLATPRCHKGHIKEEIFYSRLFIRLIIRPVQTFLDEDAASYFAPESHRLLTDVFNALETFLSKLSSNSTNIIYNHLFFNIIPTFSNISIEMLMSMLRELMESYKDTFIRLGIRHGEIRVRIKSKDKKITHFRIFMENETNYIHEIAAYIEDENEREKSLVSVTDDVFNLNGIGVFHPYPLISHVQLKRQKVRPLETSYVYDFPKILVAAANYISPLEIVLREQVLCNNELQFADHSDGSNICAAVSWIIACSQNHKPLAVLMANDISKDIGSFSIVEDQLFAYSMRKARELKIPLIFICSNSGARIGICEAVRKKFKVAWGPSNSIDYLYLPKEDWDSLKSFVHGEWVEYDGGHVFKINAILGGLGVETLSGSALIASEMAKTYSSVPTLSYVTGRAVGIGAYLARLSQRIIQRANAPIILTGVAALNRLLGRDLYHNNLSIGGPQIMGSNGIAHWVADDDFKGCQEIMKWLLYVSPQSDNISKFFSTDTVDRPLRPIDANGGSYDPRIVLIKEMFDIESWSEVMSNWARSVICGRARLGGIAVAVITPEVRSTQYTIPTDPGNPSSSPLTITQPGCVWTTESAAKTAQMISDADKEGLPLFVLANWRGFSGGQRDLLEGILKTGSNIVYSLSKYQKPVFIYVGPGGPVGGELRGGAWVVLDSQISHYPGMIEMYADEFARGGIIEPAGIVQVKFKGSSKINDGTRIFENCKCPSSNNEKLLDTVLEAFVDLHDTCGRMLSVGAIKKIVPWAKARAFFYQRLKRRMYEEDILADIKHIDRVESLKILADLTATLNDVEFNLNFDSIKRRFKKLCHQKQKEKLLSLINDLENCL